jgi:Spy/CpxP family protein refolding chaperone
MKVWIVLVSMVLVSSLPALAQEEPRKGVDPELRKEKMMEKLTTELELTTEQQADVSRVLDESHAKRQELRDKSKEERKVAKEEHMMSMKEVLTEEQFKKYKEMAKKRKEQMHSRKRSM